MNASMKSLKKFKLMGLFLSLLFFSHSSLLAHDGHLQDSLSQEEVFEQMDESMRRMESMMQKMMERSFGRVGGMDKSDDFDNSTFESMDRSLIGKAHLGMDGEWVNEKQGKVYVISGNISNDGKFDLKVSQGHVTIKGMVEKKEEYAVMKSSFHQIFPVPEGTDGEKVKLENKNDQIRIVFPWKKNKKLIKKEDDRVLKV